MDLEKLKETLKANGVEEEKIDKILADLVEEDQPSEEEVDNAQVEGNPEEDVPPAPSDEVVPEEEPVVEEVVAPNEEGEVPQEGDVPPVPPTEEEDVAADVPPTEVPPVEEIPAVPPFDPSELITKLDELKGVNEEQAKTIEGLVSRIQSLEDALQTAGVLEKSSAEGDFGIDETRVPSSGSIEANSPMSSALAKLNGNKHF